MSKKYHFSYIEISENDVLEVQQAFAEKMKRSCIMSVIGISVYAAAFILASFNYFGFHGQPLQQRFNLIIVALSASLLCYNICSLLRKTSKAENFIKTTTIEEFEKQFQNFCMEYDLFYEKINPDTSGYIVQSKLIPEEDFNNIRKLWFSIYSHYDLSANVINFFEEQMNEMDNQQRKRTLLYLEAVEEQLQNGNMLILDSIESGNGLANYKEVGMSCMN